MSACHLASLALSWCALCRMGFTVEQMAVLKAQIIAFKKIKSREPLAAEVGDFLRRCQFDGRSWTGTLVACLSYAVLCVPRVYLTLCVPCVCRRWTLGR